MTNILPADAATEARRRYDRVRLASLAAMLVLLACTIFEPYLGIPQEFLTAFLFRHQDLLFVPAFAVVLLVVRPELRGTGAMLDHPRWGSGWTIAALTLLIVLICWSGHHIVFGGYDLSRDEQMANFDAAIYRNGAAVQPIPIWWRPYADALNQLYIQPVGDHEAWVSNYLPVNAMARAMFGAVGLVDLTGPAFVGLGLLCLWSIAGRLWPEDAIARVIAPLFYLGSSQIVTAGMTAYAMNAHIGLNLLWLALFLRGGRAGHGGAMLVGLLATGIHQPLFHPLFVLPFLFMLVTQRRWWILIAYGAAYLAIGAFCAAWPVWISAHGTLPIPQGAAPVGVGYIDRVLTVIGFHPRTVVLMAMNLLRFVTWQHLLLLPLAMLGIVVGWRRDAVARSLALGLLLPLLVVSFLVPYQGHGWGYRYLHGVIGNACLLATGGFLWLRARGLDLARPMAWASLASIVILLPAHLVLAHRQAEPFRVLDRVIAASPADIVIVDDTEAPFARDLVINRPDLSNRPIRLLAQFTDVSALPRLCSKGSIGFVDWPRFSNIDAMFDLTEPREITPHQQAIERAAALAGCRNVH